MATSNGTGYSPASPDLVQVSLSYTLWDDYKRRGVFADLDPEAKASHSGGHWIHWRSCDYVQRLLDDAHTQAPLSSGTLIVSFRRLIERLTIALAEAQQRVAWLTSDKPMSVGRRLQVERFLATKGQLSQFGAPADLLTPGQPGGPKKKSSFKDPQGRHCIVLSAEKIWPGALFVEVTMPDATCERSQKKSSTDRLAERLRRAPATPDAYRAAQAENLSFVQRAFFSMIETDYGFRYSPSTINEINAQMARFRSLLLGGEVVGSGPIPLLAQLEGKTARESQPFKRFLTLVSSGAGART